MSSDKCQYPSDFVGHTYATSFSLYCFVDKLMMNNKAVSSCLMKLENYAK
jgi:hypothetical protein